MSSNFPIPNQSVFGVECAISTTPFGNFRPVEYLQQLSGPAQFTQMAWKQEGSIYVVPVTGQFLPASPTTNCGIACVINQDPAGWLSLVSANGGSYLLAPNGGCVLLTSQVTVTPIVPPNGASNWQVFAVNADGSPASVNVLMNFFFAGV